MQRGRRQVESGAWRQYRVVTLTLRSTRGLNLLCTLANSKAFPIHFSRLIIDRSKRATTFIKLAFSVIACLSVIRLRPEPELTHQEQSWFEGI